MVQRVVDEIILQGELKKICAKDETHENIDDKIDNGELYELDKMRFDENK